MTLAARSRQMAPNANLEEKVYTPPERVGRDLKPWTVPRPDGTP